MNGLRTPLMSFVSSKEPPLVGLKSLQQIIIFRHLVKENKLKHSQIILREDEGNLRNTNYLKLYLH
jgi:hypothetical protein